jgi:hypothetical protein
MISTCELGQTRGSASTETPFSRGNPLWLPIGINFRAAQTEGTLNAL